MNKGPIVQRMLQLICGTTQRERLGTALNWALIAIVVWLGCELKWALKSPTPATWNQYSREANETLYSVLNQAVPPTMPVVSHRAGNIPGRVEPSPIDRLNHNYAAGQRLFELDFAWTADEQLVVKHDWEERTEVPTEAAFLAENPTDHASLRMVFQWLEKHPDAFIVTDCKKRSLEGCARIRMERPDLVPQFIVQIYQYKDYELVQSQGFKNIILTLYRCLSEDSSESIASFVRQHPLFALTIPMSRSTDAALIAAVNETNTPIYVHTVNQLEQFAKLQSLNIYGIYSDDLCSEDAIEISQNRSGRSIK